MDINLVCGYLILSLNLDDELLIVISKNFLVEYIFPPRGECNLMLMVLLFVKELLEMSYGVRNERLVREQRSGSTYARLRKIMKCLCSGEQLRVDEMIPSSESLATKDYSASIHSSLAGEPEQKPDTGNIEEAESSLRESGSLNYEVSFLYFSCFITFSSQKKNSILLASSIIGSIIHCCKTSG